MHSSDDSVALVTWTVRLAAPLIPVRAGTIRELESLRACEDRVDANSLGEVVAADPLMTLRLMAHVGSLRGLRQHGVLQTVTAALVWIGIGPFFRSIHQIVSIEQALDACPVALQHVHRRLKISNRAARLALAFAIERGEPDAALLHHAALLSDFHELLFWVHEPLAALQVDSVQEADGSISRAEAQRQILGIELNDLKQPISRLLRLPRPLDDIEGLRRAEHPSAHCVEFALRIARQEGSTRTGGQSPYIDASGMEALMDWLDVSESRLLALLSDAGS